MGKRLRSEAKLLIEQACKPHGLRAVSFQKSNGGEQMLISFQRAFGRASAAVTLGGSLVDDESVMNAIKTSGGALAALSYRQAAGA